MDGNKDNDDGISGGGKNNSRRLLVAALVSAALLTGAAFAAAQPGLSFLARPVEAAQHTATRTNGSGGASAVSPMETVNLDGVTVSFGVQPETVHAFDRATIRVEIADAESGAPLSHVDWAIIVKNPAGEEVYKTSTSHTHLGVHEFSYAFLEPGRNTVSVQIASLGPKMMGMDVPKEAQTRIFKSGDPMRSPEVDETFFFGSRSHDFVVDVAGQGGVKELASDNGAKVELELSTNPLNIVAGQPTTLVFNVRDAATGKNIMHPDALVSIKQGRFLHSASAPAGSPMMPLSGAYHGHTGEMALTTVFSAPGVYAIRAEVNSLPVSDIQFGHVKAEYRILVSENGGGGGGKAADNGTSNNNNSGNDDDDDNNNGRVSILGQAAPYYAPASITVKKGQPVTFVNDDFVIHTATSTDAAPQDAEPAATGLFDTGILAHGEEKAVTFDQEGTYNYFCQVHPYMRGTVTVTG